LVDCHGHGSSIGILHVACISLLNQLYNEYFDDFHGFLALVKECPRSHGLASIVVLFLVYLLIISREHSTSTHCSMVI
jgi:hypothetical protein